jgi:predicted dehydrogenase
MSKKFNIGIVGMGMIGEHHAKAILELDEAELFAIQCRNISKGENLSKKLNVIYYLDYMDMMKNEDIDIIDICLPSGMHMEPAVEAAKAGKHVIVEKPIDVTLERANKIIETCKKHNVKLAVIFQSRFARPTRRLKEAVDNGELGKLVLGDAYIKWFRPQGYYDSTDWRGTIKGDGGAALINQSIHTIDLLQWIMGPVKRIYGKTITSTHKIEGEDVGLAILEFKNGALGVIEGSTSIYPGFAQRLEISGEKGTVVLESDEIKTWAIQGKEEYKPEDEKSGGSGASDPMAISYEKHKRQIKDMIDAIKENREPFVNGEEGRKSLEIVLGIYKSSKEGKPVNLPL